MPRAPKIPPAEVFAELESQVTRHDRSIFAPMLADAVGVKPSRTAWRQFGKKAPDRYVKAIGELAKLNGYVEKTEKHIIRHDAKSLALELVNRVGEDKARNILTNFGLPASLIPESGPAPVTVDGETA